MKKRVVCLMLALILLAFVLTSCGTESAEAGSKNPFYDRFEMYNAGSDMRVYIDKGTGVCYLWHWDIYKGGLTVMLDEDGRPLTYWEYGYGE